ncbi:hypothetical protein G5714_024681 [Onychostoma macrolepis]|uniref:Uncharacterized protein n=1 Tax=Onychostoma macrolepis TaxID=369639 RepID=A0A7J6BHK0_9TELE|nr:hypothetical protein G5714_024681 [Onychostoma macrolepis]
MPRCDRWIAAVRGKVRFAGTGECGWRPWRRGGHLTKPSPQAPLGPPGAEPPRQDRPSEPPYETSAPGGAFSSWRIKADKRFSPRVTVPNFSPCPRNTQPTAASALWQAGRAPSRRAGSSSGALAQSTRGVDLGHFHSAQNLSPPNLPFGNRGTSKRLPLSDPISRVAVESGTCRGGAFPACCGDSDTLDVWPEPPFRLSRFPTRNSSAAGHPGTAGRRRPSAWRHPPPG